MCVIFISVHYSLGEVMCTAWYPQAMDAALEHSTALEGKVKAFESFSEDVTQKVVVSRAWTA